MVRQKRMNVIAFSSILLAAISFQCLFGSAYGERAPADNADTFAARIFKNRQGKSMPYRLFVPRNYDRRKKYPLVLWLHGGGGRGTDNVKQISEGNTSGSHIWTTPSSQAAHPAFVLAPQCPEDAMWTSVDKAESTDQLKLALELLAAIEKEFNIDVERIYVAGQSMGGLAAWSLISEHPGMFAAAIPVCGGGDETLAPKLVKTAIWAFHGAQDQAISADRSRRMIAAIRKAGGSPRYTEYHNLGHNSWDRAFAEPDLVPWTFAQRTNGYKKATKNAKDLVKLVRRGDKNDRFSAKQTDASDVSECASSTQHSRKFNCRCSKAVQTLLSPASPQST